MRQHQSIRKTARGWIQNLTALSLIAVLGPFSNMAVAQQSENTITLLYEGEDGITGELLEFNGSVFKIASSVGRLTIPAQDLSCIGDACPDAFRLTPTLPSVKLSAADGSMNVEGNLIDVTDTDYILATPLGEFRVAIEGVTCEGDGCPAVAGQLPAVGKVVLSSGDIIVEGTLVGLDSTDFVLNSEVLGTLRLKRDEFECKGEVCP